MRYYINFKKGGDFRYFKQYKPYYGKDMREVDEETYVSYLNFNGIMEKLSSVKIKTIEEELLSTSEYVIEIDFKLAMLEIMS